MNLPRALRSPVFAMPRRPRPSHEASVVRAAASIIRRETGLTAADPIARIIAARVREALVAVVREEEEPLLRVLNTLDSTDPTPFQRLATDPDIDALELYVEGRVAKLRARLGCYLPPMEDRLESREVMDEIQRTLFRRYLRQLRE